MAIHLSVWDKEAEYTLLFVDASKGKPKPIELQKLQYPKIEGTKGLVISSPVSQWIGSRIVMQYRNRTSWVAVYDSKLHGAVVVKSLCSDKVIGELISITLPCLRCNELGIDKQIKKGAIYPYCTEHTESAPHRQ